MFDLNRAGEDDDRSGGPYFGVQVSGGWILQNVVDWAGGQKARARGLGSIRWHEANANLMKKHKVKLIGESRVVPPSSLISGATDGQTLFVIVFSR